MHTDLGKQAIDRINICQGIATDTQIKKMTDIINQFDIDLTGSGFYAIQAKQKLQAIADLTNQELAVLIKHIL